jgi:hypothetical protein
MKLVYHIIGASAMVVGVVIALDSIGQPGLDQHSGALVFIIGMLNTILGNQQ